MASGDDRSIDLIVKANIGQVVQPLTEVIAKVKEVVTALQQQNTASQAGQTTLRSYATALGEVNKVGETLLKTRLALDELAKRQAVVDTRQGKVDTIATQRDALVAATPEADRTAAQRKAIDNLNTKLATQTRLLNDSNAAYARTAESLIRIGVLTEGLDAKQKQLAIDTAQAQVASQLHAVAAAQGTAQSPATLEQTLREASARVKAEQDAATAITNAKKAADEAQAEADDLAFRRAFGNTRNILAARKEEIAAIEALAEAESKAAIDRARYIRETDALAERAAANRTRDAAKEVSDNATLEASRQKTILGAVATQGKLAAKDESDQRKAFDKEDAAQQKAMDEEVASRQKKLEDDIRSAKRADVIAAFAEEDALTAKRLQDERDVFALARSEAEAEDAARTRALAARPTLEAAMTEARARAALLSAPVLATPPTARAAVMAAAGPGRNDAQSVDDTDAAVTKLDASMGKGKLTAESYNKVMDQVFAIQRQIASDAGLIDAFRAQEAATKAAMQAEAAAEAQVLKMTVAAKAGAASQEQLARATTAANSAAANLNTQNQQQAALAKSLQDRGIGTANLDRETNKLIATTERLAKAQESVSSSSGKAFGLSAFQFQNLQFQVNDVITQLSLGQGVMRTFEAQGGQIFQLFDLSIAQMKTFALVAAPVIAVVGLLTLAFSRLMETQAAQRSFQGFLAGTTDAAVHTSAGLTNLAREAEKMGTAFADATEAAKLLSREGLDDTRIKEFLVTAQRLEDVGGAKFKDTIKTLSTIGTTTTMSGLRDLALQFGVLTSKLNDYIIEQTRFGDVGLAQAAVFNAIRDQAEAAERVGLSPFHQGLLDVKTAWRELLDSLGSSTELAKMIKDANELVHSLSAIVNFLTGIKNVLALGFNKEGLTELGNILGAAAKGQSYTPTLNLPLAAADKQIRDLQASLLKAQKSYDDLTGSPGQSIVKNSLLESYLATVLKITDELGKAKIARDQLAAGGTPGAANAPGVVASGDAAGNALQHRGQGPSEVASFLTGQNLDPVVKAWCAAFANAALQSAGLSGSGSNIANSFATWGAAVIDGSIQRNDVLVMQKGHPAGETGGHVGIATGQTKVGPNGALLVEMVSGNMSNKVSTDFIPADQLTVRRATSAQTVAPLNVPAAPLVSANPEVTLANNTTEALMLQRKRDELIYTTELGNSEAKRAQDERIAKRYDEDLKIEADAARKAGAESILNEANRAEMGKAFRDKQAAVRAKEDADIRTRVASETAAAENQILKDPTDRDAAMQKAGNAFVHSLADLDNLIARGVTESGGKSIVDIRKSLLAAQAQAVETAGITADSAALDALVATRTATIAKIRADTVAGVHTSIEQAALISDAIAQYGPKITAAVAKSNAELAKQPQTAATVERMAKNAAISAADPAAVTTANADVQKTVDELVKTRDLLVAAINAQLAAHAITLQQSFDMIAKVVRDFGPKIQAAAAGANVNLARQPQTPQIMEQQAANQKAMAGAGGSAISLAADNAAMAQIASLAATRASMTKTQNELVKQGEQGQTQADAKITAAYAKINPQIKAVIASTKEQIEAQHNAGTLGEEDYQKLTASLEQAQTETKHLTVFQTELRDTIANSIASNAVQAFETISTAIGAAIAKTGSWSDVIKSVGVAFAQFAAGVLKDVAAMIIKYEILDLIESAGFLAHGGGVVGSLSMSRDNINPMIFMGARRMHSGALVGLSAGEVPAILQTGEEVLTAKDPRHRKNLAKNIGAGSGDSGSGGGQSIRNVLVVGDDQIAAAMSSSHGEKVVLTHLKRNASAIRQLVG